MKRRQTGLTLVELLIAMSLMALLSILGYRAFASMLMARERLMAVGTQWNDLARAFSRIERDIAMLPPGKVAGALTLQPDGLQLAVTTPAAPDGKETRHYLAAPGRLSWGRSDASAGMPTWYPLLEVPAVRWQVGLEDGRWRDRWPEGDGTPVLLKLTVQLADGQRVGRLWALP